MDRFTFFRHTRQTLVGLLVASASVYANAEGPLSVTIEFEKRAPRVGLLYVPAADQQGADTEVDQIDKAFTQKLVVAAPGSAVTFKNSDKVNHNIFANDVKQGANFDVGLMAPGGEKVIPVNWQEDALVRVGCKIHPRMRMYIASVPAEFYQVVEFRPDQSHYEITLNNLPANAQEIVLRIPKYEPVTIDLKESKNLRKVILKKGKPRGSITLTAGSVNSKKTAGAP